MIPTLTTQRLVLRPYDRADFETYAAMLASPRAKYMGGPISAEIAWGWFANDIAGWALYGIGCLAIVKDGELAGFAGLVHPAHFPEIECGWGLYDGFTGQGIATEAAHAILSHAFAATDLTSVVSHVDHQNHASQKIAERIGGSVDPDAATPFGDSNITYRHTAASVAAAPWKGTFQ